MSALRPDQMFDIAPGDMVVIEKSRDYCKEAMEYGGVTSVVTSVRRGSGGDPYDIRIEADEGQWSWVYHISEIIKHNPITPATSEELTAMLFGN